jgi:Spy/CpxP family protein refolding chaperone
MKFKKAPGQIRGFFLIGIMNKHITGGYLMNRILTRTVVLGLMIGLLGGYGITTAEEKKTSPAREAQPGAGKRQVRTILDYKTDLNLTEPQTNKIRDYMNTLDKDFRVMKANLSLVNVDLQNLIEKDAEISEIKKKIRETYDIQASMRIADLETARNINKLLSTEQLKKWKAIRSQGKN